MDPGFVKPASLMTFYAAAGRFLAVTLAVAARTGPSPVAEPGPDVIRLAMVDLIPRQVIFGNPERAMPRLSPDGTRLAWIAPHNDVLNVWIAPVSTAHGVDLDAAQVVTADTDRGVRTYEWAHDNRHLLYLQDTGGDENWRLYDVDLQAMERRDLTPFDNVQTQIIGLNREFPTEVLLGLNKDNPQLHDVYRLDLQTGELTKEVDNPGLIGLAADNKLVVRCGFAPLPDGSFNMMIRDGADDDWRLLKLVPAEDVNSTEVIDFSADNSSVLMISSIDAETARLLRLDLATGAEEVLASNPAADVSGVRLNKITREPQIAIVLTDRSQYVVLDPAVADDLTAIRALHPGDPVFSSADDDDAVWLVSFLNDVGPVRYYLYDRATKTGKFLFEHQPALSKYTLASMEPFSYQARDGLTIHGYATFPAEGQRTDLPVVLYVHGGPWVRDVWGYDAHAQWLANRGYLCLQVNYRGSTGYGKSFGSAGDREWGAKMQDDLTDAVGYAVAQGWADPKRIAIFGGSYGGYAALAGATFTPDLYRCAVDIVGPSNLKTLIETIPPYWAPLIAQFHLRVGNPEADEEFLWSRSPLSRADQIRIPLLIAQGANDPRVKQAESEQIVAALNAAGIEHEYMLFPDEGHGFAKPENRMTFYAAAERFLARYLGGRSED
ncbi:MAG TPA: S9 family peptidase [Streptosporangiaceae bacterium]|nr:S9 family peptidase [Streptosporangiaceae bacterium]